MKNELRTEALSAVLPKIREIFPDAVDVCVSNKNMIAIDTGKVDENGQVVYATIDVTVKNTEDTKTSQAFDLESAVQARIDKENAPKKETKKKEADPEAEAKRAKREGQKQALAEWCEMNLSDTPMTTTDIKAGCPEMEEISIMQVGTWMTAIAKEDSSIKRDVVKGKPCYSKA